MKTNLKQIGSNMIELETKTGKQLYSYSSLVAEYKNGKLLLYPDYDYSKTTTKHITQWTGKNSKEIQAGIKDKSIKIIK